MEDFDKIKANPNFSIIGHMTQAKEFILLQGHKTPKAR
jgi:thiamine-monophosphate kinase